MIFFLTGVVPWDTRLLYISGASRIQLFKLCRGREDLQVRAATSGDHVWQHCANDEPTYLKKICSVVRIYKRVRPEPPEQDMNVHV